MKRAASRVQPLNDNYILSSLPSPLPGPGPAPARERALSTLRTVQLSVIYATLRREKKIQDEMQKTFFFFFFFYFCNARDRGRGCRSEDGFKVGLPVRVSLEDYGPQSLALPSSSHGLSAHVPVKDAKRVISRLVSSFM